MDNKELYNKIMEQVSKEVKKALNESDKEKEMTPGEKMDAWHNGERRENIKACDADKLKMYKSICTAKGYDAEVAAIQAEIDKRGLKESKRIKLNKKMFESEAPTQGYSERFMEIVNQDPETLTLDDLEVLYDELVPGSGSCDTKGGEILRAAAQIRYRNWNDGDYAGEGYGRETVNPAVRYLYGNVRSIMDEPLWRIVKKLFSIIKYGRDSRMSNEIYDDMVQNKLCLEAAKYIIKYKSWDIPNEDDMWDYRDPKEDVDTGDDYEDDWGY